MNALLLDGELALVGALVLDTIFEFFAQLRLRDTSAAQLWPCATIHAYPTHRPLGRVGQRSTSGRRPGVRGPLRRSAAQPVGSLKRLRQDVQHRARRAHPPAYPSGAYRAYGTATAGAAIARAASATDLRRAARSPSATTRHHATRRRRGRPGQPMASLHLQRARRRRMDSHRSPRPYVNCPRFLRYRTDARWSALRRRTITTRRAPSGSRLTVPTSRPPPHAATGSFGLTCRTATGITKPTVRCVVYIHSFPTTSRTQEGGFSAQRDMSSCSGRLNQGGTGWGP